MIEWWHVVLVVFFALLFVSIGVQLATWRYDPEAVKNYWKQAVNDLCEEFLCDPVFELKSTLADQMEQTKAKKKRTDERNAVITEAETDEQITLDMWRERRLKARR